MNSPDRAQPIINLSGTPESVNEGWALRRASSPKTPFDYAIRRILRRRARREEVKALKRMRGLDLSDPEIMANAWRESRRYR